MLTIQTGGTLTDSFGTIGNLPGGLGTVTVIGAGSSWTNVGTVVVGGLGTGTLTIQDGGTVNEWRRLRRIVCRLDWYGDGDRPGLQLDQRTKRRAQYRQFWHGLAYDRKRWDGHQQYHPHRCQHRQWCRLDWVR